MTVDPRTPCIIGVAQRTVRPDDGPAPEPLVLWTDVTRAAADDTGAAGRVLRAVDSLQVVHCMSWPYDRPVDRLAAELGIEPAHRHYSGIGGTTPQLLVQQVAHRMLRGELDVAVVVGAEALHTKRMAKKAGERLPWSHRDPQPAPFPFEAPFHPAEVAHQVFQAWLTFAVFEVARRARLGVAPQAHVAAIGRLLAPLSDVAAANPHAWSRRRWSADELVAATPDNRLVAHPYRKRTVAVMDVDMGAAVILATHGRADELGVPADRRVYLRGWAHAEDPVYVAEHPDLASSPAMAAAGAEALRRAGAGIDDVAHLDLYSCFASSVSFACDALGLHPADGRTPTVTGGLPFAGGPASSYMLHSIAAMTGVLRSDPGSLGLVSGVGMHMTKHAFALYSTAPPPGGRVEPGAPIPPQPKLDIADRHEGGATVASYAVVHGRDGEAEWGLVVCDVPGGRRAYGRAEDRDLLAELESREWVGERVELLAGDGGVNLVKA